MITPLQVMVFYAMADKSEALETMASVQEILVERGFLTADGEKKKGCTPGTRSKPKAIPEAME